MDLRRSGSLLISIMCACEAQTNLTGGGDWSAGRDGAADAAMEASTDAGASDVQQPESSAEASIADSGIDASPHQCATNAPKDCSPGSGTGNANECFDGTSCFLSKVQKSVNAVVAANPSWFDTNNQWGCPNILNVDGFMDGVVSDLVGQGVCAIRDPNAPGEEVTVKHDNAFSENFDIVASNGCARSGSHIYTGWCAPAWW